jgi:hypothetical protein
MSKKGGAYGSLKPFSIRNEGPAVEVFRKRDCILPGERAHLADGFVKSSNQLYEMTLIYDWPIEGHGGYRLGSMCTLPDGPGCKNLPGGALHPILHPVITRAHVARYFGTSGRVPGRAATRYD